MPKPPKLRPLFDSFLQFESRRSCVTQLLEVNYCTQLLEVIEDSYETSASRDCVEEVYLDFQKAFDTVPHQGLLNKIFNYRIQMTDQLFGAALLAGTGLAFTYYTLWVIVMPFVDEDQDYIHALFPDRKFVVAFPLLAGVIGLLVIGCFVSVVLLKSSFKHKTS